MSTSPSDRAREKSRRVLAAALDLFLKVGVQGATMEAIAKQARIAKPTLYKHFPDKIALFEMVICDLVDTRIEIFLAAFESDGDAGEKITGALTQMFGAMADIVDGSPFAGELLAESRQFPHRFAAASEAILEQLAGSLGQVGFERKRELAGVLLASCSGIMNKYRGGDAVRNAVRLLCTSLLQARSK